VTNVPTDMPTDMPTNMPTDVSTDVPTDVPVERTDIARRGRAMAALFASVALMNIAMVGASTSATLISANLGGDAVSGLPNAAGVLGTAAGALAAGTLMARHGRRLALLLTYAVATAGALIVFVGAVGRMLPAVAIGMLLLGLGNAGAQLSRYLAAELFPASRKGFALSTIVWSGTVGAVVGPALIAPAAAAAAGHGLPGLSGPVAVSALTTGCAALATALLPRSVTGAGRSAPRRPVMAIRTAWRDPAVRLSIVAMTAAHVVMVSVMLMTPLQLERHGHGLGVVGWILSAHMIGMFALAPLSGAIADRFGGRTTIGAGIAVLVAATMLAALLPTAHSSGLPVALFLLGYGWNLAFVGGSSVLSRKLPEESKIQLQGGIDAIIWGASAIASLSAGPLFGLGGYPLLAAIAGVLALVPVGFLSRGGTRRTTSRSSAH
jgi:MFS family permease